MTACVNNTEKKMGGGVFQSKVLRGAMAAVLAVGLMPGIALADEPTGSEAAASEATVAEWKDTVAVEYTVDPVDGQYVATVDSNIMAVESVTSDIDGALTTADYDVKYYRWNGTGWYTTKDSMGDATVNGNDGGAPNVPTTNFDNVNGKVAKYAIAVVKKGVEFTPGADPASAQNAGDVVWQEFTIKAKTTELKDVEAFEAVVDGSAIDTTKMADTSFKYDGAALNVAFKMGGKVVDLDSVDMVWTAGAATAAATNDVLNVTNAGTYTVKLTAKAGGAYSGSATVTFDVAAVDLSSDEIAIAPVATGSSTPIWNGTQSILVNGEPLANGLDISPLEMKAEFIGFNDGDPADHNAYTDAGKYTFKFSSIKDGTNVVNGPAIIDAYVTDAGVEYTYDGNTKKELDGNLTDLGTFDAAKGTVFTTDAFTAALTNNVAELADVEPAFEVTVMKDNEVVTDYTEPGSYTGVIETPVTTYAGKTYAGYATFEFTVAGGADYSDAVAYATIGDKVLGETVTPATTFEYTGEGIAPKAVAKMDGKTLVEGTDYTVEFTNADGEAVESAVELGEYTYTLKFADDANEVAFKFEIVKANIDAAKATAEFFALPADGSAVTPTFVGNTDEDFKGQSFDLAADQISVKYYKAKQTAGANTEDESDDVWVKNGAAIDASELTEEGDYVADINVLTTAPYIKGGVENVHFVLAERVAFSDVDANAWYADVVYKARDNHYVNGIGGTDLFMPHADIDRAQIAAIMFNMAGGQGDGSAITPYPTRFSDVDPNGWYAKAVSWASGAGVVSGYEGTDLFGTFDKATREQVAAMFYNYAKACGNDVTVEDVDGALAEFGDAAQVSGWARTAVAWAVENGVMGNGGYLAPQDQITRAEVAAMAVNYQPKPLEQPIV